MAILLVLRFVRTSLSFTNKMMIYILGVINKAVNHATPPRLKNRQLAERSFLRANIIGVDLLVAGTGMFVLVALINKESCVTHVQYE